MHRGGFATGRAERSRAHGGEAAVNASRLTSAVVTVTRSARDELPFTTVAETSLERGALWLASRGVAPANAESAVPSTSARRWLSASNRVPKHEPRSGALGKKAVQRANGIP